VIKVQFVPRPTYDALASVTLPDLELDRGRDDSSWFRTQRHWALEILFTFDSFEAKLEY
jgi:hypothetical protein